MRCVTDLEFASVAYAFLDALPRIGSGNPKGISIAESDNQMPLLVLDRYLYREVSDYFSLGD